MDFSSHFRFNARHLKETPTEEVHRSWSVSYFIFSSFHFSFFSASLNPLHSLWSISCPQHHPLFFFVYTCLFGNRERDDIPFPHSTSNKQVLGHHASGTRSLIFCIQTRHVSMLCFISLSLPRSYNLIDWLLYSPPVLIQPTRLWRQEKG